MVWLKDITILSGSSDSTIKLWNISSGKCLKTLVGHKNSINSMINMNEIEKNTIASGSTDQTVKIWDVFNGICLKTINGHNDSIVYLMQFKVFGKNTLFSGGKIML